MEIKICGLTTPAAAQAAARLGVDYLGVVLYEKSPRFVPLEQLATLFAGIPSGVRRVGVFVNARPEYIYRAVELGSLDIVQCHGNESPEYLASLQVPALWVAKSNPAATELAALSKLNIARFLLDSPGGGSGQTCNWQTAKQLAAQYPIMLAGGLNAQNVIEAVKQVNPCGVDVSSGVESTVKGQKDYQKLVEFINIVRSIK